MNIDIIKNAHNIYLFINRLTLPSLNKVAQFISNKNLKI